MDVRMVTIIELLRSVIGINIESLKSIGQLYMSKKRKELTVTDGRTE